MVLGKLILLSILIAVGYISYEITKVPPLPNIPDTYWGKGRPKADDKGIYPFTVNVSDVILNDLKTRIQSTNALTPPLEGVGFQYGFNSDFLKVILDYWANNYNWRKFENALNKFTQYKTQISGLNIHFIRVIPKVPSTYKVFPLLILHGWPGSVKEFQKIIPLLTTPRNDRDYVFEVIAPSLPGYGWSDAAVKPGLGAAQVGLLFKKLMQRLGHDEFYVQGGDWGAIIGADMATLYPENVKGLHSNMCVAHTALALIKHFVGAIYPPLVVEEKYADRMYPLSKVYNFMLEESGYFHIQATKPDTVGIGLLDSPAGLASYIVEKFSLGTNSNWRNLPDGGISKLLTLDDILDDVTIYWVTGTMTTAMRLYSEWFNSENFDTNRNFHKIVHIKKYSFGGDRCIKELRPFYYLYLYHKSKIVVPSNRREHDGVGLLDSPAGLTAYILEKFVTWTDKSYEFVNSAGLTDKAKLEDVMDDITLYWVTKSIGTSIRLYAETQNKTQNALGLMRIPTHVPTSCIMFPHEISYQSEFILKEKYPNLIQMNHPTRGGHFAAMEEPNILANDIWEFFNKLKKMEEEDERRKEEEVAQRQHEAKNEL